MELPKAYEPQKTEDKIYQLWEKSDFFSPEANQSRADNPNKNKTYTIVIPPPNVTGSLHMGHALNAVIQDILIRKKRMEGFRTLWVPGTDHAGIATQNVVEKNLKKEGKTRFDLGREKFLELVWQWKEEYGNIILNQFKKIGASCDWSRARFTMDKDYAKAVETAFLHYHEKGWIYQGKRVVNWCPRCATSLSDLELEHQEEKSHLWYIQYPLALRQAQGDDNFIIVATTRPETMLGDTAIAVDPHDKRYKKLIGQKVIVPLVNREIEIIADELVDEEFGTGAVKVTPAHDLTDYEIGQKHNLAIIQVIDEKGKITKEAPLPYQDMKVKEAREKIVEDLKAQGLLEKIEDYTHQVPKCYRCAAGIELLPSLQWFLKMSELAKLAIKAVGEGKVKFIPKNFEKIYLDWLYNIKDWCISRQIWWGHKIPIKGTDDVLDTWFSSALWPLAVLGWPQKTDDLKTFYPTQTLVTARDIINLWVARMVFSGLEFSGKEPFQDVIITPTVLTKEGKRMSKSLGTGIDPLNLIEKYGADATRFGIAFQLMGGQDMKFTEDNIVMGRKFCNKLWNASRFVLMKISETDKTPDVNEKTSGVKGFGEGFRKSLIMEKLDRTIKSVNKDLDNYQFGQAAHTLYDFFWHDFCDQFLERTKDKKDGQTKAILLHTLLTSLKLLHPFVPFITEEIYQQLPIENKKKCLMIEKWPE
ncbi:MAG: valine--tRNA ligase [Candidatus Nealsonbacteria bacterium]|nr:valine--tRNA ligase [Candidatus Nealsonbacteria bacterium]